MRAKKITKPWDKLIAISLVLILSACGFHLRGEYKVPAWFDNVYIDSSEGADLQLVNILKINLITEGIKISYDYNTARAIIKLGPTIYTESNSKNIGVSEYTIVSETDYKVYDRDKEKIVGTSRQRASYEYQPDEILASNEQRDNTVKKGVLEATARMILFHVSRF